MIYYFIYYYIFINYIFIIKIITMSLYCSPLLTNSIISSNHSQYLTNLSHYPIHSITHLYLFLIPILSHTIILPNIP